MIEHDVITIAAVQATIIVIRNRVRTKTQPNLRSKGNADDKFDSGDVNLDSEDGGDIRICCTLKLSHNKC